MGDGTTTDRLAPYRLPGAWSSINPGDTTCGVRTNGTGWCWGSNGAGAVGNGTMTQQEDTPALVGTGWTSITSAEHTTCGVKADHSGWCWGNNVFGRLGDGTMTARTQPHQLPGSWLVIKPAELSTCGVQTDHTGWCWGFNTNGEIGNGQTDDFQTTPFRLPGLWTDITPTTYNTCGVRTDATGWCWGANTQGQLGDGTTKNRSTPTQVPGSWTSIAGNYDQSANARARSSTCGVQTDGSGWCWGANDDGELGTGDTTSRSDPTRLPGSWSTIVRQGAGDFPGSATCGLHTDGSAWCWGFGRYGAIGNASTKNQLTPASVGVSLTNISVDGNHNVCGASTGGAGYCWGSNISGTVGDGTTQLRKRPVRVLADRS